MDSTKRQARIAGLLYVLVGVTAPIGLEVVPGKLIVAGNAAATADHIRASEWLLRLGIATELFHQTVGVFLVLALYRLFKGVNPKHAVLMVVCSLLPVPIMFVNVLNEVATLILVRGGDFLSVFDPAQLDAMAFLFVRLHSHGITLASMFWGLWLFPFGLLAIRSGFIPRIFGYLLLIAGGAYVISAFTTLVLPQYGHRVGSFAFPLEVCEVPIILWLAIWGTRVPSPRRAD